MPQAHQKFPHLRRDYDNALPVILGVTFYNSLPSHITTGVADCKFIGACYIFPAQGAQLATPQPGGNRHGVIGFVQNRFVHNNFQQSLHFVLLRNMLFLFLHTFLADTVRRVERNDVIFLGIFQHRRNRLQIFLHSRFLDAVSAPAGSLTEFFAHFFQPHGQQFCKRNTANQRVNNIQIAFVPCVGGSLKERLLPLQPVFCVLFKVGLVAFLDTILELFLDAFRFSHDILLNAALWHG